MKSAEAFALFLWLMAPPVFEARADNAAGPQVNGRYPVSPQAYRWLTENLYLPTRTTFLTDQELAARLDLSLPQLAEVAAALEKNEGPGLERALAAYLNSRLPPLAIEKREKLPGADSPKITARPDTWLASELTMEVNGVMRTYPLGERLPWYHDLDGSDGAPAFEGWGLWGHPLGEAHLATADAKYAQAILTYARSFYHDARPPAQRPKTYFGCSGPWQGLSSSGRAHPAYMPWVYRAVAGAPVTTDADRVMFLKMFWEHADYCHLLLQEHIAHNFEVHIISGLLNLALTFPEFRDSKAWRERCAERLAQNMDHAILADGGSHERTGYHFAYLGPYAEHYRRLRDAGFPMPNAFRGKLELMFAWAMWMMSPTRQYPNLGLGSPTDLSGILQCGAELFPDRTDFAWAASGGKQGVPPARTAKVLSPTGFLTLRSDWSSNALFMAMNYNGSPAEIVTHPDLLSFGLWAHGRAYLTNAGTPVSYGDALYATWCKQTRSSNTVLVDKKAQEQVTNGGWLEHFQSLDGFDYLAAVSDAYRRRNVRHRRAVLFVKPCYWFIYDRLDPTMPTPDPHEYRWQGHFQPTELSVDPATKTVRTSAEDGKCLFVVPLAAEALQIEQGHGVIATRDGAGDGPYVHFVRASAQPAWFAVLLCPATHAAKPPVLRPLRVTAGERDVQATEAVGCRILFDGHEDFLAVARRPLPRVYENMATDGETAFVRTRDGKIAAAGLFGGRYLNFNGKMVMEFEDTRADEDQSRAASLRCDGTQVAVDIRGSGKLRLPLSAGMAIAVHGRQLTARKRGWWRRHWEIDAISPGKLDLSAPTFSTDAEALWRATAGIPARLSRCALVRWQTAQPADAVLEYAPAATNDWTRVVDPDLAVHHQFALSRLTPETTYRIRIVCRAEDGRLGTIQTTYTFKEKESP